MGERLKSVKYTLEHRKAFRIVEKYLTGKVSIRGYFHDLDKVFLKLVLPLDVVSDIHRKFSRHHRNRAKTHADYVQMIIDFECARITKPDKPLNAIQTVNKYYSDLKDVLLPIAHQLGLKEDVSIDWEDVIRTLNLS